MTHDTNPSATEVVFHCNPLLSNVVDIDSVEVEIQWYVNGRLVEEETFKLSEKTVGTLDQTKWTIGQKVRSHIRIA